MTVDAASLECSELGQARGIAREYAGEVHEFSEAKHLWVAREGQEIARLDPTVREIFVLRGQFIVLVLVAFASLCFGFAAELAGGGLLGRCLCGFLALFWGLRALMQVIHYNAEIKRRYPAFNLLFLGAFVVLTAIFTLTAVA